MGRRIIGHVPVSLMVVSALSVALSLLIIILISSIRIKDSIVSEFRLEDLMESSVCHSDLPNSSYDTAGDAEKTNIETTIIIPINRVNDVTVGLPVLLSFDQPLDNRANDIIGYVKGVDFRVEQPLKGVEVTALVNVFLDKSRYNIKDYDHIIGKTGKAELIISDNRLGKIIFGNIVNRLSKRY
ncbi:MAG: hypothetical protein IJ584_14195 [Bacteroidales bacterium]|nr:hypothetical protein [Bacteroidales bacterium]MBR1436249.1 hypothetical protein [Bacteroidales bacterium]